MSEKQNDQEMTLITIYQKAGKLMWKLHNKVNGYTAEKIFRECSDTQFRINIKNEVFMELNRNKIVKPTNADIVRVGN